MLQQLPICKLLNVWFGIWKIWLILGYFSLHALSNLSCVTLTLIGQTALMAGGALVAFVIFLVQTWYVGNHQSNMWSLDQVLRHVECRCWNCIGSPLLLCDNITATYMAVNSVLHNRSKHIEVHHHFIQEHVQWKQLVVKFVPSKEQLANTMTKALLSPKFHNFRTKLFVLDMFT